MKKLPKEDRDEIIKLVVEHLSCENKSVFKDTLSMLGLFVVANNQITDDKVEFHINLNDMDCLVKFTAEVLPLKELPKNAVDITKLSPNENTTIH